MPRRKPNSAHAFKCQSRQNLCAHNVAAPCRTYHALTLALFGARKRRQE
jgi:hypothetical protein